MIPEGFAAVTIECSGPNSLHPPSFGFGIESPGGAPGAATVASGWVLDTGAGFIKNLHVDYRVERIVARTNDETFELPLSLPGELIGVDLVTPAVACLVKLATATPGRRGSGRVYWPGVLGDGDVDNAGVIDNEPRMSELQLCAVSMKETIEVGTETLVLLHSYRWPYGDDDPDPGPPIDLPDPSPVTSVQVQRVVATQRRRQR